ncbi:LysR substrate binding domain protein [compost metagenome]
MRCGSPGEELAGVRISKIATQCNVVCAAPSYLASRGRPITIKDLEHHDTLLQRQYDEPLPWIFAGNCGKAPPFLRGRLQFDNQEAILDAAVAGMGVARLPGWLVSSHIKTGRLVTLLDEFPSTEVDTYAVWRTGDYISLHLRLAVELLAAKLQPIINL